MLDISLNILNFLVQDLTLLLVLDVDFFEASNSRELVRRKAHNDLTFARTPRGQGCSHNNGLIRSDAFPGKKFAQYLSKSNNTIQI